MYRGDTKPDLGIIIGDNREVADFSGLTPGVVSIVGVLGGFVKIDKNVDSVTPAQDGKSATVRYSWASADTDTVGTLFVTVRVDWGGDNVQHFPEGGMLQIPINPAPGDN